MLVTVTALAVRAYAWSLDQTIAYQKANLNNKAPQWSTLELPPKYVRWSEGDTCNSTDRCPKDDDSWTGSSSTVRLETAVTTFRRINPTSSTAETQEQFVELHAQVHLADADYFAFYNSDEFTQTKSAVLFELLLDDHLLENETSSTVSCSHHRRRVQESSVLQASNSDQSVARSYGWTCQANAIEYRQPRWYHADLTRQEFLQMLQPQSLDQRSIEGTEPLWKRATTSPLSKMLPFALPEAALEAATALLIGPPMVLQQPLPMDGVRRRRIFTNLFLPGHVLATWLRYLLWIAVPSPELSVLLIDWSSSWSVSSSLFLANGTPPTTSSMSRVSRLAAPLLQALSRGRLDQMRQLVFGQMILAGHQAAVLAAADGAGARDDTLLIVQRNHHALAMVEKELALPTIAANTLVGSKNVALLFGCNHCPDLHARLIASGFEAAGTSWRTAWTVNVGPGQGHTGTAGIGLWFVTILSVFLLVSGADWIGTLQEIGRAAQESDFGSAMAIALSYLFRHVLLYVGLSKLVLDGEVCSRFDGVTISRDER
jgi:hypothetical protein